MPSRDISEETGQNSQICQKYWRGHPKLYHDSSEGQATEGGGKRVADGGSAGG